MVQGDSPSRARVSRLVKSLMLGQLAIITALSVWLYNEYLDNKYLETYLASVFQRQGSLFAMLGLGGILAIGFFGILLKAGDVMGEIEHLQSRIEVPMSPTSTLDESSSMPVLEVVDHQPKDDISTIHGSVRHWNERSKSRSRNG